MTRRVTCLEDIGDERDQAVFLAMTKLWFNGDLQAAFAYRNKNIEEMEEYDRKKKAASAAKGEESKFAEMILRYTTRQ